eukprot:TRINITY_DN4270_c3_g1_i1.p1 TRINITY_DN4270_c3_g1~~TRINITY_DN4270_c3_g1_i1.p1  ORF type:complete len:570 (+),score=54.05 TRINITY_DN4270_c3_g1_i1:56-1765(+)
MIINTLNSSVGTSSRVHLEAGDSLQDFVMKVAIQEGFEVDRTVILWGGRALDDASYLDLTSNEVVEVREEQWAATPTSSTTGLIDLIPEADDCESTASSSLTLQHSYRKRQYVKLTTAMCLVVTCQITSSAGPFLITKLDLFGPRYTAADVTMPLAGWCATILIATMLISLLVFCFAILNYRCRITGVVGSILMGVMNVLTMSFPHSKIVLFISAGLFGCVFCTAWLTSGYYTEHLLRGTPGWSLGFSSGLFCLMLHLATFIVSILKYSIEQHVLGSILIIMSVVAAVLFTIIPTEDVVAAYYPSISAMSTSLFQNLEATGIAKVYVIPIIYHGMICQQLWISLPSQHDMYHSVEVSAGSGAVASIIMGVLVSFTSPLITIGISSIGAFAGISLLQVVTNPSDGILWLTIALMASASAGYQIQTYCMLQRMSQQYLIGTLQLFCCWLTFGGLGFLGSNILLGNNPTGGVGMSNTAIIIMYGVGGMISICACAIAAKTMSSGRGWHRTLPRMSSINIEGPRAVSPVTSSKPDPDLSFDGGVNNTERQRATSDLWHRFANFIGTPGKESFS